MKNFGILTIKLIGVYYMTISENGITIDCSNFNDENLLKSEIFGHERDSWEKAFARKIGLLECASGMDFVLLNSHLLPKDIRSHLLEPAFKRLGGVKFITNRANVIFK